MERKERGKAEGKEGEEKDRPTEGLTDVQKETQTEGPLHMTRK